MTMLGRVLRVVLDYLTLMKQLVEMRSATVHSRYYYMEHETCVGQFYPCSLIL